MKRIQSLLLILALSVPAFAKDPEPIPVPPTPVPSPLVTVPAKIDATVNRLSTISIAFSGKSIAWRVVTPSESAIGYFREMTDDKSVSIKLLPYENGTYFLVAVATDGDKSAIGYCVITVAGPVPVPPTPIPPGPGPNPIPPGPSPAPAPIPTAGFRVLMIYDALHPEALTPGQQAAIFGEDSHNYLNSKCVIGPDGKSPERRIWSTGLDASGESKLWQDAYKRPRASVPWIIISDGKTGFEGPIPADVADTMSLLKKFGG